MSDTVLVLNTGSSTVKYALVQPDSGELLVDDVVERIGEDPSVPDHEAALHTVFNRLTENGEDLESLGVVAVGHRIVHGGQDFYRPTVITGEVITELKELAPLAPLHNPPGILGIEVAQKVLPDLPHIAVFDTAFFHNLPAAACTYAIDREVSERWSVRRYGFHGTSHSYVSRRAAEFLDRPLESLCQIVLHLGNGASVAAIDGGRPVDTSMGLTPLEGLVMGTRSGDIDPGIIFYLWRTAKMGVEEIETMLNRRSGVFGLVGRVDFREIRKLIESGDETAQLAYDVYIHRLRRYIGGYLALLGGADVITFTAGVGENDAAVRRDALKGMAALGVEMDEALNSSASRDARRISADGSRTTVLVIPTNEELAIARDCLSVV